MSQSGLGVRLDVVERGQTAAEEGDFAVSVAVLEPNLSLAFPHFWIDRDSYARFLTEFAELARTRSGVAILDFMSPHLLEVFSVQGTSALGVHGRFTVLTVIGDTPFSSVFEFYSSLESEYVEQALKDFRALVG